jgi:hypothetical protein
MQLLETDSIKCARIFNDCSKHCCLYKIDLLRNQQQLKHYYSIVSYQSKSPLTDFSVSLLSRTSKRSSLKLPPQISPTPDARRSTAATYSEEIKYRKYETINQNRDKCLTLVQITKCVSRVSVNILSTKKLVQIFRNKVGSQDTSGEAHFGKIN